MIAIKEGQKLGNKRKLKRFSHRCKIAFTVDGVTYRGLSSNFSLNGIFIRTNHPFPPETLLDIVIYLPNDLTVQVKGKVVRTSKDPLRGTIGMAGGYRERGMGVAILEKQPLYLHVIRALLSREGESLFENLLFSEQESKYRKVKTELQNTTQLFDVVALLIGKESKQAGFLGKVWFEAKMKNNTDHTFKEPIVIFMTPKNNEHIQNQKSNSSTEIGTVLMSSSDNIFYWKPSETILLKGEIDLLSEDVLHYERKFIDYLTMTLHLALDEPMNIDDYITTLWVGSPYIVADPPIVTPNKAFQIVDPRP
jgi:hypothetical protein